MPSALPTLHPTSKPTSFSMKKGLIISPLIESREAVEHYNGSVNWFYNYKQLPIGWQGDWADDNGVEFVPMIAQPWLWSENGADKKCSFSESQTKVPVCSLQNVTEVLQSAIDQRSNGVPVKSVMGFNEMYNDPPPDGKDLTPKDAALYWGKFVQPAANATGLELISPTLNAKSGAVEWFSDFLKECYDLRNDGNHPCNINLIKKFAVHTYDCRQSTWETYYNGTSSQMITLLITHLKNYEDKSDWDVYVRARDIWVTETNCYWEEEDITRPGAWTWEPPHANSKEQCLYITGQKQDTHGIGSLAYIEQMINVERYSLWTTWNKQIKPNYLTYKSGKYLTPLGKAYLNIGDQNVDCEFPGTRFNATDATLEGVDIELLNCGEGGPKMITNLGGEESSNNATFTVEVGAPGNYAVNVAYITNATQRFSVSVNDDIVQTFKFISSGLWCDEGGKSTVLPIELEGFVEGNNFITFGASNGIIEQPLLEWISVVGAFP